MIMGAHAEVAGLATTGQRWPLLCTNPGRRLPCMRQSHLPAMIIKYHQPGHLRSTTGSSPGGTDHFRYIHAYRIRLAFGVVVSYMSPDSSQSQWRALSLETKLSHQQPMILQRARILKEFIWQHSRAPMLQVSLHKFRHLQTLRLTLSVLTIEICFI